MGEGGESFDDLLAQVARAPEVRPSLERGAILGRRFEIASLVGVGGMGRVYRARDLQTLRDVAIKTLDRHGEVERKRFLRESRVLSMLTHSAIVDYIAHGETPTGDLFLAMEWIEGRDLAKRLERGALAVRDGVMLACGVAHALGAAHAAGIVHRDVKPANVLLQDDDLARPRLVDFGISRTSHATVAMTRTGSLVGTPSYMAPEQIRGERDLDGRVDVFALGCLLYECLTGRPTFEGLDPRAVLAKVLFEEAPRVSWSRSDVPSALDHLVAAMLDKDPTRRPRDGREVAARLEEILGHGDFEPGTPATSDHHRLAERVQRWVAVVVATPPGAQDPQYAPTREEIGPSPAVAELARRHGAELFALGDGTVFLRLRGGDDAASRTAVAARCALALSNLLRDDCVSVGAARLLTGSNSGVGPLVERVVALAREPGRVVVDEHTAGLLDARFHVDRTASGSLVIDREDIIARRPRLLLGRPLSTVGRQREVATLRGVLDEVRSEQVARAVLVTAAPGVGKSRLRHEVLREIDGFDVWFARGDVMSAGAPMVLLSQLARSALDIRESDGREHAWMRVRNGVDRVVPVPDRERVALFLGMLLDAEPDQPTAMLDAARADAIVMGDRVRAACEIFLEASCAARPLLLVLEDLHWGDAPSARIIDTALRRCKDRPLAVLAFARPEVVDSFPHLWAERALEHMRLSELPMRAAERLVREALGADVSESLVARIVQRAAGNALYLEELIRKAATDESGELPTTVQALVQARLDALDAPSRRLLQLGSVYGDVFWLDAVRALLPPDERAKAAAAADTLVARELLEQNESSRFAGERELVFRHSLVREAAFSTLSEEDARTARGLAADWLVEAGETSAFTLAEHYRAAGDKPRSLRWYVRAAQQALERNDVDGTILASERGLACGAAGVPRGELLRRETEAHLVEENHDAARRAFEDGLASATRGSDSWWALAGLAAMSFFQTGRFEQFMGVLRDVENVDAGGGLAGFALLGGSAAVTLCWSGREDAARSYVDRLSTTGEAGWIGLGQTHLDLFFDHSLEIARRRIDDTIATFQASGAARYEMVALWTKGLVLLDLGDYAEACRVLGQASEELLQQRGAWAVRRVRHRVAAVRAAISFQLALARAGRATEAHALYDQMRPGLVATPPSAASADFFASLIAMDEGQSALAVKRLRAAVTLPSGPIVGSAVSGALARALAHQGAFEEAIEHARRGLATSRAAGGGPHFCEVQSHLGLVEGLRGKGDAAGARAALEEASARVSACAARISDPSLRTRFLEHVPENARLADLAQEWRI